MKRFAAIMSLAVSLLSSGCSSDADLASQNLSKAADQFEINRRVVFYNGITGTYVLSIEGLCSLGNYDHDKRLSITCRVGPSEYKKHFLGLSDNVTFFVEQIDAAPADTYHYRVQFRPQEILPSVELKVG
ncbi:hypothetical protein AACH06_25680 [Ideonella sp. DXS29W]|uniref:Uncharacterized protein n=1 Tax=Ideonella lacteola TaxID=2984193 RepID=A0ABU9BWM6_9BURK